MLWTILTAEEKEKPLVVKTPEVRGAEKLWE
jgi:hypothetical protein